MALPVKATMALKKAKSVSKGINKNEGLKAVKQVAWTVVLVGGATVIIRKTIKGRLKRKAEREAAGDPNVQQAMMFRQAINPSGIDWMRSFDTTKVEFVYETASKVTDINKVIKAYKRLYNASLLEHLQKELKANEYQFFLDIISGAKVKKSSEESPQGNYFKNEKLKNKVVITKTKAKFYIDPNDYNKSFKHTKKVPQHRTIIGASTGIVFKIKKSQKWIFLIQIRAKTDTGNRKKVYVLIDDIGIMTLEVWRKKYRATYKGFQFKEAYF